MQMFMPSDCLGGIIKQVLSCTLRVLDKSEVFDFLQ